MSLHEDDPDVVARATLTLLEIRLRRLEFLLTGSSLSMLERTQDVSEPSEKTVAAAEVTVHTRLQNLQSDLDSLRKLRGPAGNLVRDVESLRTKVPELYSTSNVTSKPQSSDLSTTSSIVLSHASLFPETASRLSSLQSLSVPPAEQSSKLINLQPRIDAALEKQQGLEAEGEELRARSAKCLEWWVKIGVVGMGELWEEWESRLADVERDLTRTSRRRAVQNGLS